MNFSQKSLKKERLILLLVIPKFQREAQRGKNPLKMGGCRTGPNREFSSTNFAPSKVPPPHPSLKGSATKSHSEVDTKHGNNRQHNGYKGDQIAVLWAEVGALDVGSIRALGCDEWGQVGNFKIYSLHKEKSTHSNFYGYSFRIQKKEFTITNPRNERN